MRILQSAPCACAAALFTLLASQQAEARGPFAPMAGSWIGSGTINLPGGASERIRCRASYVISPGGAGFNQVLRCASDSYRVDIESDVAAQGGAVSGRWAETTRGATGTFAGAVHGGAIRGTISGVGFTATLSLVTHGRTQLVDIRLNSSEIAGVTVNFRRE